MLVFDKSKKLIHVYRHSAGVINQTPVSSALIAGRALNVPGAAFVLDVHNHPGGSAKLSDPDRRANTALASLFRDTKVKYLGAMVIGGNAYAHVDANENDVAQERPIPAEL